MTKSSQYASAEADGRDIKTLSPARVFFQKAQSVSKQSQKCGRAEERAGSLIWHSRQTRFSGRKTTAENAGLRTRSDNIRMQNKVFRVEART